MRFVTTRGEAPAVSLKQALFDGLAPDGGLYVPEAIEPWPADELARLASCTLGEIGVSVLERFAGDEIDRATLRRVVDEALDFPIPLVGVDRDVFSLELFHGPTLAFKDVGARVMARLMSVLGGDVTVLTATSGDTGSAVAHAFHGVANARVIVLYPDGRVSPTQEAQLTLFNDAAGSNVCAFAVAGSFDDCQRLVKAAFANDALRRRIRLTSANSINVGRLLPQMIYYFHGVAQLTALDVPSESIVVCTPSGNFGNLTAGLMARRAGLRVAQFVAATNANDVVPAYLSTGFFEPRPSIRTIANAMDVGNPSNLERLLWLYGGDVDAVRRDVVGSRSLDEDVRLTIRDVYARCGYLLDPHSAIGYAGVRGRVGQAGTAGIFLATAHPAKFPEVVEPVIDQAIEKPASLAAALAGSRRVLRIEATLDAVIEALGA